jgi:hypothetical protein
MQYGLDLTRLLLEKIEQVADSHGAQLVVMQVTTDLSNSEGEKVHVLNGKYYRVSREQLEANMRYVNSGFRTEIVPVTATDWRVAPDDGHLNRHANEQVFGDLAVRLQDIIP